MILSVNAAKAMSVLSMLIAKQLSATVENRQGALSECRMSALKGLQAHSQAHTINGRESEKIMQGLRQKETVNLLL